MCYDHEMRLINEELINELIEQRSLENENFKRLISAITPVTDTKPITFKDLERVRNSWKSPWST